MNNAEYAAEERPPLDRCWRVKNTENQVSGTSDGTKSDEDAAVRMHRSEEGGYPEREDTSRKIP